MFREPVLIETLWNVKKELYCPLGAFSFGINRNIVECKGTLLLNLLTASQVLIETLWNVKMVPIVGFLPRSPVLIETLWNVKAYAPVLPGISGTGINRNIVECKVINIKCINMINNCINRNIVECKEIVRLSRTHKKTVLIETLWNVKKELETISLKPFHVLIETLWNVKEF